MKDSMTFNTEQQQVIRINNGRHLVLAPPGCGKTAVLAERVRHALEQGFKPEEMACLTFTNRAARGMQERIKESNAQDLFVGNVHRFCSRYLFETGLAGQDASIIDTDTSMSIIADYMGEDELLVLGDNRRRQQYSQVINLQHLMYQCKRRYPAALMVHRDALKGKLLKELCEAFGLDYTQESAICLYEKADHYFHDATPALPLSMEGQTQMRQLYGARCYELYKHEHQLLDFEDLLLHTYDSFTDGSAKQIRQFRWLQVDEVQDLSPLQMAIVDLFTAPDATVVYLGDTQQAIFSFMGAQASTLMQLRERCGSKNIHNFFNNYRSPAYLLDVYNTFGEQQLGIAHDLLPNTDYCPTPPADALQLKSYRDTYNEVQEVARIVERLQEEHPDETTAVVVAYNSDADDVSRQLRTPHFKISGQDVFSTPAMRLLLAHLSVLHSENNYIAWANILTGLKLFSTNAASRKFLHDMQRLAIAPTDLLTLPKRSYTGCFVDCYEQKDIVIFDTETTGLDVFEDEVAQIAAVRVRKGQTVDRLNLFLEVQRPIPEMLGDLANPLVEEYQRHPHLTPAEAYSQFFLFAEGASILGHNATFDYQIMQHQMERCDLPLSMRERWPHYLDSLKLARLLCPHMKSYKLRNLLEDLHLEGQNSHLADDDIMATKSLVDYCYHKAKALKATQQEFLLHHEKVGERFRNLYAALYLSAFDRLFARSASETKSSIENVLEETYHQLADLRRIEPIGKWQHITNYLNTTLLVGECGLSLSEQLARHVQELSTLKEADLCGSVSLLDNVFVSTVHKAKGLEFDNVIVYDVVRDKFPSYYSQQQQPSSSPLFSSGEEADDEEARKFYVAISRARKRLILTWAHEHTTPWHKVIRREPSPYLNCIKHLFNR